VMNMTTGMQLRLHPILHDKFTDPVQSSKFVLLKWIDQE
jgi:hypothetical protein